MVKKPVNQLSPGLQFPVFIVVSVAVIIIGYILAVAVIGGLYGLNAIMDIANLNFSNPKTASALYLLQVISTTLPIFIAPVFFAYVIVKEPAPYLKATSAFPWVLILITFVLMFISSPFMELLSNVNQRMVLPPYLSGVEKWMKQSEESAEKLTMAILKMDNIADMLKNLFLVGFLTAVAEEFMFRGVLQTILQRWTKSTHAAVWIGAALFSAFHMEFYGFLPRMFLGGVFGYLVAWSGSIWPAVWAHFLNNGTAVVVTYLYNKKQISFNPEDQHLFSYVYYIFSLIIIIILLLVYKNLATGKKQSPAFNGEELG
ncbi:CPBP family intramembrane metalloprotease [Inquilinus sp. KBS0705]|nr:CPBP family intramembrane metalloprotease [Inquilinus sp. KBS0705]